MRGQKNKIEAIKKLLKPRPNLTSRERVFLKNNSLPVMAYGEAEIKLARAIKMQLLGIPILECIEEEKYLYSTYNLRVMENNDKFCIFKDEKFENQVIEGVPYAVGILQEIVKNFNAVTGKIPGVKTVPVSPAELSTLIENPEKLYNERLLLVEVPNGLKREAYLKMMQLPVIKPIFELWVRFKKTGYVNPNLYLLEFEEVPVNEGPLQKLAASRHMYIKKDSDEYQLFKELKQSFDLPVSYSCILSTMGTMGGLNKYLHKTPTAGFVFLLEKLQALPGSLYRLLPIQLPAG